MRDDSKYIEFPSSFWVKFTSAERKFLMSPKEENLREVVHVKVVATDGYTSAEDYFVLYVDLLPFSVVF